MRTREILQRQIESQLPHVHKARLRTVFDAVWTVLRCGHCSLTSVGRAIAEKTSPKHGIKRVDRLLGNLRLHEEHVPFYRAIARRVIAPQVRPVILVDWTAVTPKLWAIVAAVPFEGRAIIIYARTYSTGRYLKPYVHRQFLRELARVLPPYCAPIVVADAGFRAPFMQMVSSFGWDYVVRLRGPTLIRQTLGRGWVRIPIIFGQARSVPTDFGRIEIARHRRHVCRLVGIYRPVHHRKHRCRVRHGTSKQRERRAAREPWILATSLDDAPKAVVQIYEHRMKIEETFRDAKSVRFGVSLAQARTNSSARASVLLLLASLAHLFAVVLGLAAELSQLHRRLQANTIRNRRVLSLAMVGRLIVASGTATLLDTSAVYHACEVFSLRLLELQFA
jgi:hypothetical protein